MNSFWIFDTSAKLITGFGFRIGRSKGKRVSFTLTASLFVLCTSTAAQPQSKIAKIGWLAVRPASAAYAIESFQREFRKLGYVEGKERSFHVSTR